MSDKKSFQGQVYPAQIGIEWEARSLPSLCSFHFPSAFWETVFNNLNQFYAIMELDLKKPNQNRITPLPQKTTSKKPKPKHLY